MSAAPLAGAEPPKRTRSVGWIIALVAIPLLAIAAIVVAGGAVAFWALGERGGGAPYVAPFRPEVSFGDGYAILAQQGFPDTSTPFVLRALQRTGTGDRTLWEWSHQGQGLTEWNRDGSWVAGELMGGTGPTTSFVFERDRGLVAELRGVERYSTRIFGDEVVVRRGAELALYRLAEDPATPAWTAPTQPGAYVGQIGVTASRLVSAGESSLDVYSRASGGAPLQIAGIQGLAGVAATREEALVLRDGRLEVVSLADGSVRTAIDVGAPVWDSIDVPCLFGSHAGSWIVAYSTEPDHSFTGVRSYMEFAERTIAAVDAETGAVRWRYAAGTWDIACTPVFEHSMRNDEELGARLFIHARRDSASDVERLTLLEVLDLDTGASMWRTEPTDYVHAGGIYYPGGALLAFRPGERGETFFVRFTEGRLAGAVLFPDYVTLGALDGTTNEVWVGDISERGAVLFDADLAPAGPLDSTDGIGGAISLLQLPPAARP